MKGEELGEYFNVQGMIDREEFDAESSRIFDMNECMLHPAHTV